MATSTVTSPTKFYPEGPNISNPSLESSDSSLAQLKRTIWACIRLGRLHTVMAYAIFPAPAIYAVVVWFAIHKEQFLAAGIDRATILRDFADLLFRLTVVIMSYRSAGLAWDDLIDRSFDGQVTRTKTRPLPAGNVSVDVACLYIAVQSFVTLVLTNALLPGHLMEATLFGGALIIPYPFMKRFTSFTQFGGALLIANGVLQGWAACASSSLAGRIGENHGSGWVGLGSMLWHNRGEISTLLMLEVLFEM
jgi:4-hydroxybenzoate polyprenyltransferase